MDQTSAIMPIRAWFLVVMVATVVNANGSYKLESNVTYHTDQRLTFKCQEGKGHKGALNWYLNGHHITRGFVKQMKAWRVDCFDPDKNKPILHDNKLVLKAAMRSYSTSFTLTCTKKRGRYANNIIRIFHLVKEIEPTPTELGKHRERDQLCPLYRGKSLTLSCGPAALYHHVDSWTWERDDTILHEKSSSSLVVSEPGNYSCSMNHGSNRKILLKFKVKRKRRDKSRHGDWLLCNYDNNAASVTKQS